jgi:CBS domain-containing protein
MKVSKIMTARPVVCSLQSTLGEVARVMGEHDCGVVPLIDDFGRLIGILTDRDICLRAAPIDRALSEIHATAIAQRHVVTCRCDDDVQTALRLMKEHRVRRLPVLGTAGRLEGIVSLSDIVLAAGADVADADVVGALKAIYFHQSAAATTTQPCT